VRFRLRRPMRAALLVLALSVPASGMAQTADPVVRIAPGSTHLETGRIPVGTDTLMAAAGQAEHLRVLARVYLQTNYDPITDAISRVERVSGMGDQHAVADSFVLSRTTLAPRFAAPMTERGRVFISFAGDSAIHREATTPTAAVSQVGGAFYGNSMDILLRSLRLRRGFTATVSLYEPSARSTSDAQIIVDDVDVVRTAAGERCETWRVRVESRDHGGTYWVSTDSGALIRYQASAEPVYLLRLSGCGDGSEALGRPR
jgi:hypothetical protein